MFERKIVPLLEAYCDHDEQTVKKILANSILLFLFSKENIASTRSNNPKLEKLNNLKLMSKTQIKTSINTHIIDNKIEGLTETYLKELKGKSSKDIGTKLLIDLTDILVSLVGSLIKKP